MEIKDRKAIEGKLFYKFLKEKCVLLDYFRAFEEQNPEQYARFLQNKDFISFFKHYSNINVSFIWRNTADGDNFWRRLDNELYKYKSTNLLRMSKEFN